MCKIYLLDTTFVTPWELVEQVGICASIEHMSHRYDRLHNPLSMLRRLTHFTCAGGISMQRLFVIKIMSSPRKLKLVYVKVEGRQFAVNS